MADRRTSRSRHPLTRYIRGDDDSIVWAPIVFGLAFILGVGLLILGSEWSHERSPPPGRQHSEAPRPVPSPTPTEPRSPGQ